VPILPGDFSPAQLADLRTLLLIARGLGNSWANIVNPSIFGTKDIHHFLFDNLQLGRREHRTKLQALYDGVYRALTQPPDRAAIKSSIKPLLDNLYGRGRAEDRYDISLSLAEAAHNQSEEEHRAVAERLGGVYATYRKGTGVKQGGEIVLSVLRIFDSRGPGGELLFEIAYPIRYTSRDACDVMIHGRVFHDQHHVHLVGHDRGSESAYLMIMQRDPRRAPVEELFGIAMRCTTGAVGFASRVYGTRYHSEWKEALRLPSIRSVAELPELMETNELERILRHTDNSIDNANNHILRIYER
jgi:hypothetical protein